MEEIINGTGLVHFVIANEDDHYYTRGCRKYNFQEYIYHSLYHKGFRNVYYINEVSNDEVVIVSFNKISKSLIDEKQKSIWSKDIIKLIPHKEANEDSEEKYLYKNNLYSCLNADTAFKSILRIYKQSTVSNKTAVVISANALSLIGTIESVKVTLNEFTKLNNKEDNALIVVFPPDVDKIVELIAPENTAYNSSKGLFSLPVFTDVLKVFSKNGDHCFFFPIEALSNTLGKQLVILNRLEKNDIENFMDYFFMRHPNAYSHEILENSDWFTLFIWSWYNISCFSDACRFRLAENPLRKIDVIEESIDDDTLTEMNDYVDELNRKNSNTTCDKFFEIIKRKSAGKQISFNLYDKERPSFIDDIFEIQQKAFEEARKNDISVFRASMWGQFQNIDKLVARNYRTTIDFSNLFDIDMLIQRIKEFLDELIRETDEFYYRNNESKITKIINDGEIFAIMDYMVTDYYDQISNLVSDNLRDDFYISLSETKYELYSSIISLIEYSYKTNNSLEGGNKDYLFSAKNKLVSINNYIKNMRNGSFNTLNCNRIIKDTKELVNSIRNKITDSDSYSIF